MTNDSELSRRERQIMNAIYAAGEATAAEVVDAIQDPPSKTAVRTMLGILVEKKMLKYSKRGREYVYRPSGSIKKAGKSAMKGLIETFFGGSLENAIATHLADNRSKLDEEELKRIEELIKDARKNQN